MKTKWWMHATSYLLLLSFLLNASGCLTPNVLDSAKGRIDDKSPSLRVLHTYLNPDGRLVVVAQGGAWQQFQLATPIKPIWFEANLKTLAPTAKKGVMTLPESALQPGAPDYATLAKEGFQEVQFFEFKDRNFSTKLNPIANSTTPSSLIPSAGPDLAKTSIDVTYHNLLDVQNAPAELGYWPRFSVRGNANFPNQPLEILDEVNTANPAAYVLLPFAVAGDVVCVPIAEVIIIVAVAGGYRG